MPNPNRLLLTVLLTGLTAPALAALPEVGFPLDAATETAIAAADNGTQPLRLADNDDDDDDDGWRRGRRGGDDQRRGRRHHDDDDDDDDDDEDDDDGGRMAPRRIGPAPTQNPLIGAPRAVVN